MKRNTALAQRFSEILYLLNQGKRVDINLLADHFGVSVRTIQRDINERLDFLSWEEKGPRFYKLHRDKFGLLNQQDIERFALFASVSALFPEIDRRFYQEKLTDSIKVKGFQYEDISKLKNEFELINQAIEKRQFIHFQYTKSGQIQGKFYKIAPYSLINKNGIWYLIGTQEDKKKTFCFTQITMPRILEECFEPNQQFMDEIKQNESISFGNQINEVLVKVSAEAAPYFLRRNLLPNQKLVHKSESGELILSSENINEFEIVPIVQYWIPHLTIISPSELQGRMVEKLQNYLIGGK